MRHTLKILMLCCVVAGLVALAGASFVLIKTSLNESKPTAELPSSEGSTRQMALFQLGEQTFYDEQLPLEFRQPLYEIRKLAFEQQLIILEQAIVESYIAQQAAQRGLSKEDILIELFPQAQPTEEQLRSFYDANRTRETPPFARIRAEIAEHLLQVEQERLKKQLLTELLISRQAHLLVEAPTAPQEKAQ